MSDVQTAIAERQAENLAGTEAKLAIEYGRIEACFRNQFDGRQPSTLMCQSLQAGRPSPFKPVHTTNQPVSGRHLIPARP
jgi:hypothetical protein